MAEDLKTINTHVVRIRHDFSPTVYTRPLEDGGWQFGRDRGERGVLWVCGNYKSEALALRAAQRRLA